MCVRVRARAGQRILESHSFSGVAASERHLAALVLSPTRELAVQVLPPPPRPFSITTVTVTIRRGGHRDHFS